MRESRPSIGISTESREGPGVVARIVIDNQARINVLDSFLIQGLASAVASLQSDESIRVLVLTGAGERAFIGGADIREMAKLDADSARTFIEQLHRACAAIREFPAPVIARIRGFCLGAGLEIAASCDLRVASEDSLFGMPEVKVGIPSVIEAALLPGLIGWGKTRELVLTGKLISGREALDWGLIDRLVPAPGLDDAANQWIESILESGPRAIRIQKALIRDWQSSPLERAIERGIEAFAEAYKTDEPRRLMEGFLNRHGER
jgi:enoyl-CoA hydratase